MVVVRARSKEEAVCRRGPHKLWLKRATIRLLKTETIPTVDYVLPSEICEARPVVLSSSGD
ncbi:hypothetical protein V1478_000022 [Vespula squamosa]|uniref:Uncharacterized protein n=1 Tax=Vespula squamosa TaxID=30214 RepID=A0ABD2AK50_VESSQ